MTRAQLAILPNDVGALQELISELRNETAHRDGRIRRLEHNIDILRRIAFGRGSEKRGKSKLPEGNLPHAKATMAYADGRTNGANCRKTRGCAVAGFLVHVIVERFALHLPYHRMEQQYAAEGLDLSRSVLQRSAAKCAELFEPIYEQFQRDVLDRIGRLYAIEDVVKAEARAEYREPTDAEFLAARQQHSKPELEEIRAWLDLAETKALSKSPMAEAIRCCADASLPSISSDHHALGWVDPHAGDARGLQATVASVTNVRWLPEKAENLLTERGGG